MPRVLLSAILKLLGGLGVFAVKKKFMFQREYFILPCFFGIMSLHFVAKIIKPEQRNYESAAIT